MVALQPAMHVNSSQYEHSTVRLVHLIAFSRKLRDLRSIC